MQTFAKHIGEYLKEYLVRFKAVDLQNRIDLNRFLEIECNLMREIVDRKNKLERKNELFDEKSYERNIKEQLIRYQGRQRILFACLDREVSGMIRYFFSNDGFNNYVFLSSIYVLPSQRGNGIGRRMIRACKSDAIYRQARFIKVYADKYAVPFYEKLNFVHDKEKLERDDIVRMILPLNQ
ncbi:MAG: GNAT family N-acetyltransferase [Candidatus Pacearchaeota archaeon]